jgi:hypothetical protein
VKGLDSDWEAEEGDDARKPRCSIENLTYTRLILNRTLGAR